MSADVQPQTTVDDVTAEPLLVVDDLRVAFGATRAVDGLSYTIARGHTLALIGESGSGKSVGARALLGLLPGHARIGGSIRFAGTELVGQDEAAWRTRRGRDIAMIFQDPARSLNPTMTAGAQVREAVRAHPGPDGRRVDRRAAHERAIELLGLVRIPAPRERAGAYPHQLSGGMRQRVMIACALAGSPRLLVADEATTALDVTTQAQILELLADLQEELGTALLLISHDLGLASEHADDVVVMYAGRAVERAPADALFGAVRMRYTEALLDAVPRADREPHSLLPVVPGRPPDPSAPRLGCPFAPRCAHADDRCRDEEPSMTPDALDPAHEYACWHPAEDPS